MKFRLLAITAALALSAMPALSFAGTHKGQAKKPDLTGVWIGWEDENDAPVKYRNTPFPKPAPFTAEGRKWSEYWGDPAHNLGTKCIPWGGPSGVTSAATFFPLEFIQKDKQVTIINEYLTMTRRVYLDGRSHPKDLEKTWYGHSIGHWEGDTLVVDTVGVHHGPLNGSGSTVVANDPDPRLPYAEDLHLVERLRLVDGGRILQDVQTFEDPLIYTHAWSITRYWRRAPELDMLEYVCTENRRPGDEGTAVASDK